MKLLSRRPGELKQMVQCLELYYRQAKSQKDVAEALGVSPATVSRLLKRAVDEGLVRVELDLPRTQELETALVQRFGLREAVVVAAGGPLLRVHALSDGPRAARAPVPRPRPLSP